MKYQLFDNTSFVGIVKKVYEVLMFCKIRTTQKFWRSVTFYTLILFFLTSLGYTQLSQFPTTKEIERSLSPEDNSLFILIWSLIGGMIGWLVFVLVISIVSGVLIARDANSRGMNGWGWGIFTFLVLIVAVPIYVIVRKPHMTNELPSNSAGKSNVTTPTVNLSDELQSLVQLKEQGMLTDDEFQLAKKKLIE